ncbi:MAG: glycosyltransferase [Gemmatimonadaceae bacterium]
MHGPRSSACVFSSRRGRAGRSPWSSSPHSERERLRVLILGPYPPPHGGGKTHIVARCSALLRRGFSCMVLNITRHRRDNADDIYYPRSALELVSLLRRLPSDVIHLHFGGALSARLLGLAWVCTLLPRRKTVLTFHSGGYPSSPEGRTGGPHTLRGIVLRRLDHLIAVNAEIVSFFCRLGCAPERLSLIPPHAIGVGSEAARDGALSDGLQRFLESHHPSLISVGLLEPEYDLPLQLSLLTELRRGYPRAGLILIGSGSLEPALRDRIVAMPDAEHVLLCGDLPHAETLRAMASSDVVLRTTLYDGDSISVREALHLGVPVVATDNGMRPPGVRLFPVADLSALLKGVLEALNASWQPRAEYAADDDGEENIRDVLALYERLLAGKSSGMEPPTAMTPTRVCT